LPDLKDRTRALSLSGPVRWRHTRAHRPGGVTGHDTKYFIRCRIIDGEFDCPPMIRGVRLNATLARHAADAAGVITPARSTGAAWQRFQLPHAPVVPGSVRLRSIRNGVMRTDWREVPDLERSGAHAPHFVLDARTGALLFGDGRSGVVPEAGTRLEAVWKVGGGRAGNVPHNTLAVPRGAAAGLDVEPLADACAGRDAETLDETKARAFQALQEQRCAATLEDLQRLAQSAPALPVARAFAILAHPDLECLPAAGCVTVVIVPRCVDAKPAPSAALCQAVANHLEPSRPLTLELHVTGPRYTRVAVCAELALERGAARARVIAQAEAALRKFLHPLDGGPDGKGWTVGRAVYRSEVLAVLDAIPAVHHVVSLELVSDDVAPAACGDIALCASGLVTSGMHVITAIDGAVR
jgi:predicted phage baseplate assembly protein